MVALWANELDFVVVQDNYYFFMIMPVAILGGGHDYTKISLELIKLNLLMRNSEVTVHVHIRSKTIFQM